MNDAERDDLALGRVADAAHRRIIVAMAESKGLREVAVETVAEALRTLGSAGYKLLDTTGYEVTLPLDDVAEYLERRFA